MSTAAKPIKESRLQRALRRLGSSNAELESEELQQQVRQEGAVPILTCEDRQQVALTGTVATVTITPRAGHPALEVELRDGSGAVTLLWLGRRQIPGIDPGRTIKIWGRISCHEGKRLVYNPRYELLDGPAA
ncbi:OB-fold nucleic acid binding domain-containing protein [uncultured Friedmanniella sp.]|uniref:OB-fold nucleic acid binding domain-containing protein n=1 Tax=uncultured Friedmanniella sp. TaxID=335381 RepID=UPI0035CA43D6